MIDWNEETNPVSFQSMKDLQDVVNEQRKLILSGQLDRDSLLLSNEAIAEAASVKLVAQFQSSEPAA